MPGRALSSMSSTLVLATQSISWSGGDPVERNTCIAHIQQALL